MDALNYWVFPLPPEDWGWEYEALQLYRDEIPGMFEGDENLSLRSAQDQAIAEMRTLVRASNGDVELALITGMMSVLEFFHEMTHICAEHGGTSIDIDALHDLVQLKTHQAMLCVLRMRELPELEMPEL